MEFTDSGCYNARQFDNKGFKLFCSDIAISHYFSSPGHPQANGQLEVTNRMILRNLKERIPTGETPFSLVYGIESVILVKIGMPSFKTSNFDKENNEIELKLNLDLFDEKREQAEELNAEKLSSTWEGPYKVIKISRPGNYWLKDLSGKKLPHPWNVEHLKKYYQ
ncbi:hypothetical protein Acr_00g0055060 [Actinidia rufa]|uniref:Integrase catalytic domain-containing protein n=1 Tax=Actinidia rufa TaxID=165716 RepID=A0A7J0DM20_9ERIC|nr:hypothetical protein Acr_00g0055060 [Actinidia rufa]